MVDTPPEGVLVVDKATGPTSHDVVAQLRRLLGVRRMGHCGTLDPLASGVLVVCLGRFTRLSSWVSAQDKEYLAGLCLGAKSDTGDAQGCIVPCPGAPVPARAQVEQQLAALVGDLEQVPPRYSAIKVGGVPSHVRARRGEEVALRPRRVRVERLDLESYGFPHLRVRVVCSSGTYIRALAADLGTGLGCGAYVHSLRRLRVGRLDLSRALTLEEVAQVHCRGELAAQLVEPQLALDGLERVELAPEALRSFVRGRAVALAPPPESGDGVVAVYGREQVFYGLGRWLKEKQVVQPVRVLRDGVPAEHG